ncbi:MAG TPA: CDP-alcohol phosphatidyltransferase family protein [Rhodopila sp.]|uniref:CDP-alcohol phosphatidyltransferase family protein n=1 Tax=Rhodopila sp. TaxID=2480087 RepID=UPI002D06EF50|nr:CDP-alcohol phosphatidyltransferase family protein [Rhodopila sp.]HVY18110.1 CDP-alcohol phosphatidyltransferase family protein [Rhodopila sp.]
MPEAPAPRPGMAAILFTLPNLITFGRICAVPLAFWALLRHRMDEAFVIFVAAGLSDALDGWLARRRGGGNLLGAVMDPVADKALLVTMYISLAAVDVLPDWLAILVVFRDLVIVGGILLMAVLGHEITIQPLYISKLNTVLQILLVAVSLLESGFGLGIPILTVVLIWCVAVTTLASGTAYVWNAARGE